MAYTKTNWVNDSIPAINAQNLNNIENGIEEAHTLINNILNVPTAGFHNSIYRGKDITSSFYDGTVSEKIADGTFDDIFIGDYIIGNNSGRKYLVADINYRLNCGDTECTTPHILMIPEKTMGNEQMNTTNTTTGAYVGSEMYKNNLSSYKTIINNDFGSNHILKHRNHLQNEVTDGYESSGGWCDSTVELMNELMVYGTNIFHNVTHGTNVPNYFETDKTQISLFRLDKSKMLARNDDDVRQAYWLRSISGASTFCYVGSTGNSHSTNASTSYGVRPCFLIY